MPRFARCVSPLTEAQMTPSLPTFGTQESTRHAQELYLEKLAKLCQMIACRNVLNGLHTGRMRTATKVATRDMSQNLIATSGLVRNDDVK